MRKVLDTSFLIAYHNKNDIHYEKARSIETGESVINDYVYNETLNIVYNRNNRRKAVEYGKFLRKALKISRVSKPVFKKAVENFEEYDLSFTDAAVAATAQKTGIGKVAAFDEDFDKIADLERIP